MLLLDFKFRPPIFIVIFVIDLSRNATLHSFLVNNISIRCTQSWFLWIVYIITLSCPCLCICRAWCRCNILQHSVRIYKLFKPFQFICYGTQLCKTTFNIFTSLLLIKADSLQMSVWKEHYPISYLIRRECKLTTWQHESPHQCDNNRILGTNDTFCIYIYLCYLVRVFFTSHVKSVPFNHLNA